MLTRIIGTGSWLPEQIVTNDDLAKIMDTSDELPAVPGLGKDIWQKKRQRHQWLQKPPEEH